MQRMLLGPTQAPLSGPYVRPQLLYCTAAPFSGEQSHLAQMSGQSSPLPPPHILGSSLPITADWGAGEWGWEKGRSEVGGGIRSQTFGPGASSVVLFMLRVPCGSGLAWAWLLLAWVWPSYLTPTCKEFPPQVSRNPVSSIFLLLQSSHRNP